MATKDFPLSLTIKAIDKATGPLGKIGSKIAALQKSKLGTAFGGLGSSVKDVGSNLVGAVTKMAALGAGAGAAFFAIAHGAMEAGDNLATVAQRTGLTVDAFAQLRYAAAQSDVETEAFASGMDKFNKNLGLMRANSGPIVEFLGKVGPGFLKQMKGTKGTADALALMTKAFEKIEDPQRRAALAQEMFGKSGGQFGQWLGTGGAAIEKLRKHYEDLHGSQEKFANGASDLDNATKDTVVAFEGLRDAAFGELFPALTGLAKSLTDLLAGNRGKIAAWAKDAGAAMAEWVKGGGVQRLADGLVSVGQGLGQVVDFLGGFRNTAIAAAVVLNGSLIGSVLGLAVSLGKVIWAVGSLTATSFVPWAVSWIKYLFLMRASILASLGPTLAAAAPFIAIGVAVGSVSLAVYELIKHWGELKEMWKDGNTFKAIGDMLGHPLAALKTAKDFYFGPSSPAAPAAAGAIAPAAAAKLSAASAAPPVAGAAGAAGANGKVTVELKGAPKGTRVRKEGADVDLDVGYANGSPG